MKKYLLILLLLLPCLCKAQFELTPSGLKIESSDKSYMVKTFEGKTANELYTNALNAITSMYNSPQDVISKVENSMISINGVSSGDMGFKIMGMYQPIGARYKIVLRFKDGRVRVDIPYIIELYYDNQQRTELSLTQSSGIFGGVKPVFKKDGSVRYEGAKSAIENYFNNLISVILVGISGIVDDNW